MVPISKSRIVLPSVSRGLAILAWVVLAASGAHAESVAGKVLATTELFAWRPFLGPFHSLVLHYPIGFLTLAVILEFYQRWRPQAVLADVVRLVIWLSLITGLLSAGLGIMRASGGGYEGQAVDVHRAFGLAVPVATVVTLWAQKRAVFPAAGFLTRWLYRGSLGITLGLLVVAGHYGGNLTHGSKYLVQNAPSFVKAWLAHGAPTETTIPRPAEAGSSQIFNETVGPIFEAKCIRCHGPEKQKGRYRLDQRAVAFAGGESGRVAIKPGDPMASELIRLVLLPLNDDDVMPPEGKEPLTAAEVLALVRWIQAGAPFPEAGPSTATPTPAAPSASRP